MTSEATPQEETMKIDKEASKRHGITVMRTARQDAKKKPAERQKKEQHDQTAVAAGHDYMRDGDE